MGREKKGSDEKRHKVRRMKERVDEKKGIDVWSARLEENTVFKSDVFSIFFGPVEECRSSLRRGLKKGQKENCKKSQRE